jgi:two-component system alkaline phosphatase synthesis response regulator PhoP
MNEHILFVEDEEELCVTLGDRFRSEGYVVDIAMDGRVGFEKATKHPFDLIILDVMLPYRNGFDLCTDIRRAGFTTPILLLTARSQTLEKVLGLKLGADDYMTKPFDTFELMARIEAVLRRAPGKTGTAGASGTDLYRFGSIVLDIRRARVTRDDVPITLTAREFCLLRYLAEHRGIALTRDELLRDVWGHRVGTFTRTVDMHVSSLRQKLEHFPQKPEILITVPGIGYKLQG